MAEWSKALAWKVSIRQKRIEGSNPSRSATYSFLRIQTDTPGPTKPAEFGAFCSLEFGRNRTCYGKVLGSMLGSEIQKF